MKILKLTVKNFRKFNEKVFTFGEGLNVVQGLNEAGKSTLSEVLLALLFADPTTKSKGFFDKFGSWDQGGSIFIQAEGTSNGGRFRLTKDFGLKIAKLENLDSKKETSDIKAVEKSISQLLGVSSIKVFESSAFVRQSDLAQLETSEDLVASIQNAASSGGAEGGVGKIYKEIDKELLELKKGLDRPTNSPGKIKETENKINQLKASLSEMNSKWEKIKNAAGESKNSKGNLDELRSRLNLLEKKLEYNKKFKDALQKIKEVEREMVQLERKLGDVKEVSSQILNINESLSSYKNLISSDLEKEAREINEIVGSLKNKKQTLERISEEPKPTENNLNQKNGLTISKILFPVLIAIVSIIIYVVLSRLEVLIGGILIAFIFLALRLFSLGETNKKNEDSKTSDPESELKDLMIKDEDILEKKFMKLGVKDTDEFYTMKAKLKSLLEEKSKLEALQKGILEGKTIEEIKDIQAKILSKKKEIETNELTEDVKNSNLSSEEYLRTRREIDTLRMEERRLVQLEAASTVRVEDADVSIDDIVEAEEQLEKLQEDHEYYTKRRKVLELVKEAIELAVEDTAKDAGKIIKEYVKKYLPKLTADRYEEVKINKDLSIEVFSKDKGDWVDPVGNLSSGTVDQIYFLIRLAILDMIAGDAHPLVILDDPFVTFDKNRKEVTKQIIQEVAQKNQIILLTHSEEYKDWGNLVKI